MIFNKNINKKQNTRKKNLSLNHIFSCRNSSKSSKNYQIFIANNSKNDNIIIENNKFIRTNKKNPTLQNLKHKNLYNASNLNEQINQLKNIKNNFIFLNIIIILYIIFIFYTFIISFFNHIF